MIPSPRLRMPVARGNIWSGAGRRVRSSNPTCKVIIDEQPINPKYYERMSVLLDELIQKRRADALAYQEYLKRIVELSKQVQSPAASMAYPNSLDTNAKRALYDNLGKDEALALALDSAIRSTKKDDWRGNPIKKREVKNAIKKLIPATEVDPIFELVLNQKDY